jgi:hypothetical protein
MKWLARRLSRSVLSQQLETLEARLNHLSDAVAGLTRLLNLIQADSSTEPTDNVVMHRKVDGGPSAERSVKPHAEARQVIVIVSADTTTQPTRLRLQCSEEVSRAQLDGNGVVVGTAAPLRSDPRIVQVDVACPPLTPETPLQVTLTSRTAVEVVRVERVY